MKINNTGFHVLTVGMDFQIIDNLWDPIQAATGFDFSHVMHPSLDLLSLAKRPDIAHCFAVRDNISLKIPPPQRDFLATLEQPGVPTIHNMILSDRVLRTLDYTESLSYAAYLGRRLEDLFRQIKPSVIISGFDGLHSSIAMAVARKLCVPWFALAFTTIPAGLIGFCTEMTPGTCHAIRPVSEEVLRTLAERTLGEFEARRIKIPAYLSANSMTMIIKRMPKHIQFYFRTVSRATMLRFDKYTHYSARRLAREYFRKRRNLLFLPKGWLLEVPPPLPYLFIGLHRQPESSIDVWAPFYSNQVSVIEAISRSTPPTHQILVKLHKSDADNYSRKQLDHLRRLPGVRLVSPFVDSRTFIENASLVLAIQGNIALEAALLGLPVLIFGDSRFLDLPSVSKVNRVTDLPIQIRGKLSEERPTREAIVRGFMSYLSCYAAGCSNNWDVSPSAAEIEALADLFQALRDFVWELRKCAE